MTDKWQELKETIAELRENGGTGTQQEVCKFLADLMDLLEEHMKSQDECIHISKRATVSIIEKLIGCITSETDSK